MDSAVIARTRIGWVWFGLCSKLPVAKLFFVVDTSLSIPVCPTMISLELLLR